MARHYQPFRIPPLILLLSQVLLVIATCYGGDQSHTVERTIYTACNQNTPFSMCLRSQADPAPPDTGCLPNGLALNPYGGGQFWRQGCTDPSWQSDYCLKAFNACPNDVNGNAEVTSCSGYGNSTTWCCGGGNTACCGQAGAITIAATIGPSSTSSSTVLSTTSSTTSSSVTPISTSNGTALSVGAEAGIGVGVSLAGLAILGVITWFVLRIRRRRRGHVDGSGHVDGGEHVDGRGHDIYFRRPELDGNSKDGWGGREAANVTEPQLRYELDGGTGLRHQPDGETGPELRGGVA